MILMRPFFECTKLVLCLHGPFKAEDLNGQLSKKGSAGNVCRSETASKLKHKGKEHSIARASNGRAQRNSTRRLLFRVQRQPHAAATLFGHPRQRTTHEVRKWQDAAKQANITCSAKLEKALNAVQEDIRDLAFTTHMKCLGVLRTVFILFYFLAAEHAHVLVDKEFLNLNPPPPKSIQEPLLEIRHTRHVHDWRYF